ncbi:MAG TPA: CpsD/CapB family tyrosine-protein kinase, partial [Actinomycetota bacterium]|nr:CpsD/CapB family tyrosine-protein kinase [Actinomycetota bacterium]
FERQIKALRKSNNPTAPQQIASLRGEIGSRTSQKQLLPGLIVIQEPRAVPVVTTGFQPPSSRTTRVLIAAAIGLLAGLILALALERFDTKIRTRQAAEQHFGYPVLAEIPVFRRKDRKGLPVASRPAGAAADAFRLLTVGVAAGPPAGGDGHPRERTLERSPVPKTVLVTSAGPADGKSTVAANLAAAFGEQGKRVMVLSCDMRRPSIHRRFGLPVGPGLSDAIVSANGQLELGPWKTRVRNVLVVPSGLVDENPGELLGSRRMHAALEEAASEADVVILDSSPVLVANDVTSLLAQVDSVVLVARANKTRADLAERTGEILRRAGAPVVGLAFNGTREINLPTSYRRYYKHARGPVRL